MKKYLICAVLLAGLVGMSIRTNKPEARFFMIYYYGLDSLDNFIHGEYGYWAHDGRMPTQEDVVNKMEKDEIHYWRKELPNIDMLDVRLNFHMIPFEFKGEDKAAWLGGKKYKALYDKFYK